MERYRWIEPGEDDQPVVQELSRAELLQTYWPWWVEQMVKVGRLLMVTEQNCVDDFVVVHWAEVVRQQDGG